MLEEIIIKSHSIPSPFYFAPINTGLVLDGRPTDDLISFHKRKSSKFVGINYVGNIALSKSHVTNKNTLYISDDMSNFSKLAFEIKNSGSLPGAQIACYNSEYIPNFKFKHKNKSNYFEIVKNEVATLSHFEINKIIDLFATGIRKLVKNGFSVIQIHGAHGYFLNSFFSKTMNKRKDEYGNDSLLILKKIIEKISDILQYFILDLRISLFEEKILQKLSKENKTFLNSLYDIVELDMISISNGFYNVDKNLIYPGKSFGDNFMVKILDNFLDDKTGKVWNISGNIRDLNSLPLDKKHISYSVGRPIIADNEFISKYFNDSSTINECTYDNRCHYYSRGLACIECPVNKSLF
ncbi:oxidoreductase [Pedobacter agri]|uniref:NADH:flavin oxidoreductase/NADH oxidase N-terminal domain-containing protein n=1 Tax=Pedobacter agri TaxID=454586 RepID=A0A9X3I8U0_9SPHI|nr:hypothetical protein [Pedobacter agri]MCX3265106.1 hypothetical protein [Pedobacter agri]